MDGRCCANCGAPAPGRFCSDCGQETRDPRLTIGQFTRDFFEEVFSLDSRLLRSLPPLLFRPGRLTTEYFAGRRTRYVRPLKLYLVASLLFFLSLSLPIGQSLLGTNTGPPAQAAADASESVEPAGTRVAVGSARDTAAEPSNQEEIASSRGAGSASAGLADRFMARVQELAAEGPEQARERIMQRLKAQLPKAMFILLPIFALLLQALYRRSDRYYVEHLVFALHFHAFLFIALTVTIFTPFAFLRQLVLKGCVLYLFLALYRVYGHSLWKTTVKFAIFGTVYMVLQFVVGMAIMLGAVFF